MNLRPLHDRVVMRRSAEEGTATGGIVLRNSATATPIQGAVVGAGIGVRSKLMNNCG
jgi:chaperonin GroES